MLVAPAALVVAVVAAGVIGLTRDDVANGGGDGRDPEASVRLAPAPPRAAGTATATASRPSTASARP